jgi:8-hydroxy-5-deazaflavin:NADPH oxidoreductase
MTTISIIGSGNMATAIGTRAANHGHTIELMSRNTAKAQALADQIGNGATVGTFGARPAGDIVILAVLHAGAVDVVAHYGDALAGKILVDITNPFNADARGLVTTPGNSVSQQIAAAAPEGAQVVKAFNSIFGGVLAGDKPLDAFFAGDSAEAKARVAAFLESLDMRALDAGGLEMTYALEWAGILLVGLANNGAGFDIALGADIHWRPFPGLGRLTGPARPDLEVLPINMTGRLAFAQGRVRLSGAGTPSTAEQPARYEHGSVVP